MIKNFDLTYFLGDSLSDTGNFLSITGGAFPVFPYAEGRFSNGDVWTDYFSDEFELDISLFLAPSTPNDGVNFSIGGVNSGDDSFDPNIPFGFTQQIDAFEALVANESPTEIGDDLFFLWVGANDYLSFIQNDLATPDIIETDFPETRQEIREAVIEVVDINIAGAIEDIIDTGAKDIVVFNLPALQKTPLGRDLEQEDRAALRKLTNTHNRRLARLADRVEAANPHVNVIEIDIHELFNDIFRNPHDFGFTNVKDGFTGIDLYTGVNQLPATGNPDEYMFHDSVHPSTLTHSIVFDLVADELTDEGLII